MRGHFECCIDHQGQPVRVGVSLFAAPFGDSFVYGFALERVKDAPFDLHVKRSAVTAIAEFKCVEHGAAVVIGIDLRVNHFAADAVFSA